MMIFVYDANFPHTLLRLCKQNTNLNVILNWTHQIQVLPQSTQYLPVDRRRTITSMYLSGIQSLYLSKTIK